MSGKLRNSKQREAILSFLKTRKDHPTADVIYEHVKEEIPNISLGTVYRNLGLLTEQGDILKLSCDDKTDHYDACTVPHYHFHCLCCGAVCDVAIPFQQSLITEAEAALQANIIFCNIMYSGTCQHCLQKTAVHS